MDLRRAECTYLAQLVRDDIKRTLEPMLALERKLNSPHVTVLTNNIVRHTLIAERLEREALRAPVHL